MTTYTAAISDRLILACAPDGSPDVFAQGISAVMRLLSFERQMRIKNQLLRVAGVTLFADDIAALRAKAFNLWHAHPGALDGLTNTKGKPAKVAARLGNGKPRKGVETGKRPAMEAVWRAKLETNQTSLKQWASAPSLSHPRR